MDQLSSRRAGPAPASVPAPSEGGAPRPGRRSAFADDPVLTAALDAALDEPGEKELVALGAYWGSAEAEEVARIACASPPALRRFDEQGRPVDQVEVHPAYHALMKRSVGSGLLSSAWEEGEERTQHRMRAAALHLTAQCERGHLLPVSATHAAVAALACAGELEAELFPLIASRRYDRRPLPLAHKEGASVALALAEPPMDGAAATCAEPAGGNVVRVTGTKWLVAGPTSDLLLVLAEDADGPTTVMVPRLAPENAGAVRIEALTDVGGLTAQAFGRIAFDGAEGRIIGEPGRGLSVLRDVRTLLALDGATIAAGAMRAAVVRAVRDARREGASAQEEDGPLRARLLADIALESAAQTALAIRLATAFDQAFERDGDHAVARLVTAAAGLAAMTCAPTVARSAREAVGPSASVAGHPVARIAADVGALSALDGGGTRAAAELARLVDRDPNVLRDALEELGADLGSANGDLVDDTLALGERAAADVAVARAFAEQLAMVAAASAMRRNLPRVVADAYVATRLRGRHRAGHGAFDGRFDADAILDLVVPGD
ncbi:hypothetical protein [Acuticoccus sp.]|uniref:hypothetical protein n=1 Tax=Acuticoccus sp. TaxID=1904378 RepID=UPI003B51748C